MNKIVFFTESLNSGGAERVLSVISNYFSHSEWDVEIIVSGDNSKPFYDLSENIHIRYLSFNYESKSIIGEINEQVRRLKIIRDELSKIDDNHYIVSFLSHTNFRTLISSILLNKKIYCCEHNHFNSNKSKIFKYLKLTAYLLFSERVSVLTKRDFYLYPKLFHKKLFILPNPLGLQNNKVLIKEEKSCLRFLSIGRLCEQKAFERLLNIIRIFHDRYPEIEFELNIAGDGPDREYLNKIVSNLGINKCVNFYGNVKNVEKLYVDSDIFLMTSKWEGLPMVLGEAMAFGLPIIAYDCPTGPREFIKNNITGFLIQDNDEYEFINSLYLLSEDENLRNQFSEAAVVESKSFEVENIYKYWCDFLRVDK